MGWWLYIYKESDDIRLISVELCGGGKSTTGIAPSVQWRRVRVSQIIKKIAHHISILARFGGFDLLFCCELISWPNRLVASSWFTKLGSSIQVE